MDSTSKNVAHIKIEVDSKELDQAIEKACLPNDENVLGNRTENAKGGSPMNLLHFITTYNPTAPKRTKTIQAALVLAVLIVVFGVIPGFFGGM